MTLQESQEYFTEILDKNLRREYWLLRRQENSTVWHVFRQIVRSDGTKLRNHYFCTGCKRIMTSLNTASLRSHTCHVDYLEWKAKAREDADPRDVPCKKNLGHRIHWSYRATKTLLQLWEHHIEHLRNGSRNKKIIFQKIAKQFNDFGFKASDIKNKMDKLSDYYRREAERAKVTGQSSKWQHFHGVQKLINAMENNNSSSISLNEESSSPKMDYNDDDKFQDDSDMESFHSLEFYEDELDQQHPPTEMYSAKRRKDKRLLKIQEERLALAKENNTLFQHVMKEMLSYHKNVCHLLCGATKEI